MKKSLQKLKEKLSEKKAVEKPIFVLDLDVLKLLVAKSSRVMELLDAAEAGAADLVTPSPLLSEALKSCGDVKHAQRLKKLIEERDVHASFGSAAA